MLFSFFFGKTKTPSSRSSRDRIAERSCNILPKANLVLNLILTALVLISVRLWHLSTIQYSEKLEESRKPQRKTLIEPAKRGTIRDRFNIPLAINKIRYQAAVLYAPIRSIPAIKREQDNLGNKVIRYQRKEYIKELAELLGDELKLDPLRLEDEIHSKAALFYNIPYVIKDEITEEEYYRLKLLEKDWIGIQTEIRPKREYTRKKSGSDLLGYMGAISQKEYEKIILEMKSLKEFITAWEENSDPPMPDGFNSPFEVEKRLLELEELAYTAHDYVGKAGIEGFFEEELRGRRGKKSFVSDARGNFIEELPGAKEACSGNRVILSISSELQEYAERLLAQNEEVRKAVVSGHGKTISNEKQPWIKGGAIVAMEPKSGEILTLATWPRYDPNDFIMSGVKSTNQEKKRNISRWFESDAYISSIWNRTRPLERELFDSSNNAFIDDKRWLTWEAYLEMILPENHPIALWFETSGKIKNAVAIQLISEEIEKKGKRPLRELLKEENPPPELLTLLQTLARLMPNIQSNYNKLLLIDLCQIAVKHDSFTKKILNKVGRLSIEKHMEASSAFFALQEKAKAHAKEKFHINEFLAWREKNEKSFLKAKREWEKENKQYPKPYIDYLDEQENLLFSNFWQRWRLPLCLMALQDLPEPIEELLPYSSLRTAFKDDASFKSLKSILEILSIEESLAYLSTLRSYEELKRPLKGKYRLLRKSKGESYEKHLAGAFYPTYGFGYGRSFAFRQAATQGSLFKIVTAYEALIQQYYKKNGKATAAQLNPLLMTDKVYKNGNKIFVGLSAEGAPIPQIYKGGRIPRSSKYNLGKMDILKALETSSNAYFSILASDVLESPEDLTKAAKVFSFGTKTGIDLPGEISGKVPGDLTANRTGLYAMAIGQHSLVVTPIQTAVMLSACANGGLILKPKIVNALAGGISENGEEFNAQDFPYQDTLALLGIDFPLFNSSSRFLKKNRVETFPTLVKKKIDLPDPIRFILLEGMRRVVIRTQSESLWALSRLYANHPEAISDYIDLKQQLIGKTSTSESMERIDLDEKEGTNLYTHTWFGGIAFEKDVTSKFENPELVVVVYLRFGGFGKEAAPIASQIVKKWREIKQRKMRAIE